MSKRIAGKSRRVKRRRKARIAQTQVGPLDTAHRQWRNPAFWVLALAVLAVTGAAIFAPEPNSAIGVLEILIRALLSYPQRR